MKCIQVLEDLQVLDNPHRPPLYRIDSMEKRNLDKKITKTLGTSLDRPPKALRRRSQSWQHALPSTNSFQQTKPRQHNTSGITHRPLVQRKLSGLSKEKSPRRTFDRKPRRIQSMNSRQQRSTTPSGVIKRSNSYVPRSKTSANTGFLDFDMNSHTDIWIECLLFRFKEKPRKYFKSINSQICVKHPPIWAGGDIFYLENVMEQDEESFIEVSVETQLEIPFDVSDMHDITTKQTSKTGEAAATRKKEKSRESGRRRIRGKLKAFVKILMRSKKIDHA